MTRIDTLIAYSEGRLQVESFNATSTVQCETALYESKVRFPISL